MTYTRKSERGKGKITERIYSIKNVEDLRIELERAYEDQDQATTLYSNLSNAARRLHLTDMSEKLLHLSQQEWAHKQIISGFIADLANKKSTPKKG
jgi:rubrerythrin